MHSQLSVYVYYFAAVSSMIPILLDLFSFWIHSVNLGFTGIDQEYQKPKNPDVTVKTADCSIEESMFDVIKLLEDNVRIQLYYYVR